MSRRWRPSRRTGLRGLGTGLASAAAGRTAADPVGDAVEAAPSVFGGVGRRVDTVRYPLVGGPAGESPVVAARCVSDPTVDRR